MIKSNSVIRVCGLALCLAWSYCAYPPVSSGGVVWEGIPFLTQLLLRLGVVGAIPCIAWTLLPATFERRNRRSFCSVLALALWLSGWIINLFDWPSANLLIHLTSVFVQGVGTSFYLIWWGITFSRGDADAIEQDFVSTIIFVGAIVVGIHVFPPAVSVFLGMVPFIQLALLWLFVQQEQGLDEVSNQGILGVMGYVDSGVVASPSRNDSKRLRLIVLRTVLAISAVSFVWCMFAMRHMARMSFEITIFGCGFLLAGVIVWLFVRHSPSIGFVASTRWVLLLMALGLLCNTFVQEPMLALACLLLGAAHAVFELLLRMQVVHFAYYSSYRRAVSVGWGFTAIMLGAFLGSSVYMIIDKYLGLDVMHLTLWVLTVLVLLAVVLLPIPAAPVLTQGLADPSLASDVAANNAEGEPAVAAGRRADSIAAQYGLTGREREILQLLLEGRSRPYIRDTLYLSISTVDTHVRHIYSKTNVHNKQELINLSQTE